MRGFDHCMFGQTGTISLESLVMVSIEVCVGDMWWLWERTASFGSGLAHLDARFGMPPNKTVVELRTA